MTITSGNSREIVIDLLGSPIHAWVSGPETGLLVVLIHGATMDHRMFEAQFAPLTAAGYQVLTMDLRGHGKSKPIGMTRFTVTDLADDVLALVDEVGAKRFVVIGQSLGGYIAQDLVLRNPERIIALGIIGATCSTAPISRLEKALLRSSLSWFRWWPYGHLKKLTVDSLANSPSVREYAIEAMGELSKEEFLSVWRAVTQVVEPRPGYVIEHPILLTHGDQDATGNVRKAAPPWAQRDPQLRHVVIPDSRHNANQDNPEFYNRVLLDFLAENAPAEDLT